ncbi:hypothetical protein GCM10010123_12890 [Pilimelia anulata]|uniref:DUF3592 domain-containing protein n=1 Tax=Pilimelia anulata TaxID=53371 RepID=A0A8J3B0U4_9ACTN|nr:DUF3592 domain-containing protein [Pilimelia anulata]GGJ84673.1 hypothetical protein GCM10010123_12890 [Pilimelia anulata]
MIGSIAPLPALLGGALTLLGIVLGYRGLRLLRRGWLARRHTAVLLADRQRAHAVVVGREPGTVGSRLADLRPVVRFTDAGGARQTLLADLPLTRRPVVQPLQVGDLVTVAYDAGPEPAAEVLTAGSDGPAGGLMTSGMIHFSAGIVLVLCGGAAYLVINLVLVFTP